jgi:phosphatidyl-myo-inositol dimannoside synthase
MRVLVAASRFPQHPEAGGPRAALDLCLALTRHVDVTVLAPARPGAPARERWGALEVRRAARITPRALRRTAREHGCEVVHALGLFPLGLASAWTRGRTRRFALATTLARRDAFALPRLPVARSLARWFAARCDAVVAPASNVREAFERVLGRPSPTRVVLPGVDAAFFRAASEPRVESPFPGGFVLFAGRLAALDGLDVLLRALPRVRERHPGLGLVALGDGLLAGDLRALVNELGLAEWVRFPGLVDRARVAAHLHACRAACVPSTVDARGEAEAVPSLALEALAAGARVVATDAGGVPDLIEPGRNGWLALAGDPADLAARLLDALDAPLPPGVSASADAHDWARVAEQHVEIYARALRG